MLRPHVGIAHAAPAAEVHERFKRVRVPLLLALAGFDEGLGRDFFELAFGLPDFPMFDGERFAALAAGHGPLG